MPCSSSLLSAPPVAGLVVARGLRVEALLNPHAHDRLRPRRPQAASRAGVRVDVANPDAETEALNEVMTMCDAKASAQASARAKAAVVAKAQAAAALVDDAVSALAGTEEELFGLQDRAEISRVNVAPMGEAPQLRAPPAQDAASEPLPRALVESLRTHIVIKMGRRGRNASADPYIDDFLVDTVMERVLERMEAGGLLAARGDGRDGGRGRVRQKVPPETHEALFRRALGIADTVMNEDPQLIARDQPRAIPIVPGSDFFSSSLFRSAAAVRDSPKNPINPRLYVDQLLNETESVEKAAQKYRDVSESLADIGRAASLSASRSIIAPWFNPVVQAIEKKQQRVLQAHEKVSKRSKWADKMRSSKRKGKRHRVAAPDALFHKHLAGVAAHKLATIALHEIMNALMATGQNTFALIASRIGQAVNAEVNAEKLKSNKRDWDAFLRWRGEDGQTNVPRLVTYSYIKDPSSVWDGKTQIHIGAQLIKLVVENAVIDLDAADRDVQGDGDNALEVRAQMYMDGSDMARNSYGELDFIQEEEEEGDDGDGDYNDSDDGAEEEEEDDDDDDDDGGGGGAAAGGVDNGSQSDQTAATPIHSVRLLGTSQSHSPATGTGGGLVGDSGMLKGSSPVLVLGSQQLRQQQHQQHQRRQWHQQGQLQNLPQPLQDVLDSLGSGRRVMESKWQRRRQGLLNQKLKKKEKKGKKGSKRSNHDKSRMDHDQDQVQHQHMGVSAATRSSGIVPAFRHVYYFKRGKKSVGALQCHPHVLSSIRERHAVIENVHPHYLPMLVPPRPWTAHNDGGYLTLSSSVMRTKGDRSQREALRRADLTEFFDCLNSVAEVPWAVNKRVYQAMRDVWEDGGGVGELPLRANVPMPPYPSVSKEEDAAGWYAYERAVREAMRTNRNRHSLRCDALLKMGVAESFQDKERMYLPHNVDFRGRVYPIPPHLCQVGPDLSRGLLIFAERKPLGENGLRWLKIHFSNLCGNDKCSFDDRVAYAESRLDDIFGASKDPSMYRWWRDTENPWQVLATSLEIADAINSGSPEAFRSRLPVHQDGSCNGLQHYAALGRDSWGGRTVNITPSTVPQDVYSGVCDLVNEQVDRDCAEGVEEALLVQGHVTRKVVKQTVMTSVYGVTFIGARNQIFNRLQEALPDNGRDVNNQCATYLAKLTMDQLANMFSDARKIMDWLADCATTVASEGQSVAWVTPLGLPVVQPYRRRDVQQIKTLMQSVSLVDSETMLPVSVRSQRSAFPPNYVHSLDSTHMLMTARDCKRLGITFGAVHDSFWTHAGTVETLNTSLRQQFVKLYTKPILEDLRESFMWRFPKKKIPQLPPRGDLDINKVLESPYFFA